LQTFEIGDIVTASESAVGLVIGVEKDFYTHSYEATKSDRVQVMWHNGSITEEPAGWLLKIREQEE
jgi:hypothetical protein